MGKEPKELAQLGIISNNQTLSKIKSNRKWDGGNVYMYVYEYVCVYVHVCVCIYICVCKKLNV